MANRQYEQRRHDNFRWGGYQGKPIPPGAKPVKSAAADVPSEVAKDKDAPSKHAK